MKLKYYLRGLGIGIICTTLILTVAFHFNKSTLSDEEIMARARELGMVMADEESGQTIAEVLAENTETETSGENNTEAGSTQADAGTSEEDVAGTETASDAGTPEQTADPAAQTEPEAVPEAQPVTFTVNKGDAPRIVAENLAAAGLVDNSEAFVQYLREQGMADFIQVGTYSIMPGSDYAAIAEILVEK